MNLINASVKLYVFEPSPELVLNYKELRKAGVDAQEASATCYYLVNANICRGRTATKFFIEEDVDYTVPVER